MQQLQATQAVAYLIMHHAGNLFRHTDYLPIGKQFCAFLTSAYDLILLILLKR